MTDREAVQASPRGRVLAFLAAFREADNDADMELRIGKTEGGEAAVIITLAGIKHAFTAAEARKLATIMEDAMNACPNDPDSATVPNTIMVLRLGADQAEDMRDHGEGLKDA